MKEKINENLNILIMAKEWLNYINNDIFEDFTGKGDIILLFWLSYLSSKWPFHKNNLTMLSSSL